MAYTVNGGGPDYLQVPGCSSKYGKVWKGLGKMPDDHPVFFPMGNDEPTLTVAPIRFK